MFTFTNDVLTATMLDPADDRDLLGPRYCWGGYLRQLRDAEGRELFSGPKFPALPSPFNGQGAPEVFCHRNFRTGETLNREGQGGIILGIGAFDSIDREPILSDLCEWQCTMEGAACTMVTEHQAHGWRYRLTRKWELRGMTAISSTRVENRQEKDLEVLWYPHPFYPLIDGGMDFRINVPVEMQENPGFLKQGDRISMIPDFDWETGRLEWLEGDFDARLEATFRHPITDTVTMSGDMPVSHLPLWANARTISLEPYSYHRLEAGQSCEWSIRYRFGDE